MTHPLTERANFQALEYAKVLAEASSWGALKQHFIDANESTQDYCPNITGIRLQIDDIEIELSSTAVLDFINELEKSTNFLTWEDEDVKRFDRECV